MEDDRMLADPNYTLPYVERSLTDFELGQELAEFEHATEDIKSSPPGKSKVVAGYMASIHNNLHDPAFPEFSGVVVKFIHDRPELTPHMKVQLFWRVSQYFFMRRDAKDYGPAFRDPRKVDAAYRDLLLGKHGDHDRKYWEFSEMLESYSVQTNIPARYVAAKIAIPAYALYIPKNPSIVDSGTSAGMGRIHLEENMLFKGISINTRNRELRSNVRANVLGHLALANNVGFDKVAGTRVDWVVACQYPEECFDSAKNSEILKYEALMMRKPEQYKQMHGDLTQGPENLADIIDRNNGRKYDVAMAFATLYMIPPEQRPMAVTAHESLTDGLSLIGDFGSYVDGEFVLNRENLNSNEKNSKFRVYGKLMREPGSDYQHLMTFNKGRANRLYPTRVLQELLEASRAA